jgi:hypothetical protein
MSDYDSNKKSSKGCGFGCLIMLAVAGSVFVAFAALVYFGVIAEGFNGVDFSHSFNAENHVKLGEDEFPVMLERWSSGSGTTRVVRVPVSGMIMLSPSPWGERNAVTALRSIRRATHDATVKALILEVNSGGGVLLPVILFIKPCWILKLCSRIVRLWL